MAYLMIAMEQYMDANKAGAYNIGAQYTTANFVLSGNTLYS